MLGSAQIPAIILDGNQTQELIAPVQNTLIADRNYTVGQQFILNGTLYKVTTAITSGNPIITSGSSANCELADIITEQLNTKKQLVTRVVEEITAADGYITFPTNRCVISAVVSYSSSYCPLLISPINGSSDRAYVFIDRSTTGYPIKAVSSGTTYTITYKYIPNSF